MKEFENFSFSKAILFLDKWVSILDSGFCRAALFFHLNPKKDFPLPESNTEMNFFPFIKQK